MTANLDVRLAELAALREKAWDGQTYHALDRVTRSITPAEWRALAALLRSARNGAAMVMCSCNDPFPIADKHQPACQVWLFEDTRAALSKLDAAQAALVASDE